MNQLVPVDELHWDDATKRFNVLSHKQTEEIIEACLRLGMSKKSEIFRVVKEYETVMSGVLLFREFLAGRIGIYEFNSEGDPVFEKARSQDVKEIEFVSFDDSAAAALCVDARECDGRLVSCDSESEWDVFELYRAVVGFCSRWGIDILSGENPEDSTRAVEDQEFLAALRCRGWSVTELERGRGHTRIKISLYGKWLRTKY